MSEKINILEEMSNFTFVTKYARYDEKKQRRETWDETVNRVEKMHLKKYSFLDEDDKKEISKAFDLVREKKVSPSMRSMQFGGKAIEAHNARIYNCAVRHIDSIRSFSESFYILLCGTGIGYGITDKFLNRLPDLVNFNDKTGTIITYVVQDNIEGWADSLEALLNCYFKNTAYSGRKIVFDYSKIRPEGAKLKIGGGKAPGYKGLKNFHNKVKKLLDSIIEDKKQIRIKTIDVYDILMNAADAVLSGGIRRSACSVIFDINDKDMLNAKTGNWFKENPQRARSNNSVLILRNKISYEEFNKILLINKEFGEPGFVFANSENQLLNPCQPKWATVLTHDGIKKLENVNIGDEIWSETGWTKIIKKWSNGIKKVYQYQTTAGVFYGTENHKLVSNGIKIEAKDCKSVDILSGFYDKDHHNIINAQDIMDGIVFGDGSVHKMSNNLVHLYIGKNDQDYFNSEISDLIIKYRPGLHSNAFAYEIQTTITHDELPKTYERIIPNRFFYGDKTKICSFLRGLYTANGSICGNRITLKGSSFKVIQQVNIMLSSIGIKSYFTSNKPKKVKFSNGEYDCRESYDLNISIDKEKFLKIIGFIQNYKTEKLNNLILNTKKRNFEKNNYKIKDIKFVSEEEVLDISVDNHTHTYWTGGLNVSNCFEISFIPITEDGICGYQFCNLTSINGAKIDSFEKFKKFSAASALIGTLQAGYTKFPYLSHVSEQLCKEEYLLGCSITGMLDNPKILLNAEYQKMAAKIAVETNEIWAKKININKASRVTCVKPEGTNSIILMSGSGIHPHHAKKYIRRIQCNKLDNVYNFFKLYNEHACEASTWSENKTDDIISFPIEVDESAIVKTDLNAITHLELIKLTQENWVNIGTTDTNKKPIKNSVSCTIIIKEDEWEKVSKYLFENQDYFTAVSLIPDYGDKIYRQAPMEEIKTKEDEEKFNNLIKNWQKINYTKLIETDDETRHTQEISCANGKCDLIKI